MLHESTEQAQVKQFVGLLRCRLLFYSTFVPRSVAAKASTRFNGKQIICKVVMFMMISYQSKYQRNRQRMSEETTGINCAFLAKGRILIDLFDIFIKLLTWMLGQFFTFAQSSYWPAFP
jgi:hypothetical protein